MNDRTGWSAEMDRKADELRRDPVAYFERVRYEHERQSAFSTRVRKLLGIPGQAPKGYQARRSTHP